MLTSPELKSYAHMRRIKIIDHAWKDYLQDLTLHLLYKKHPEIIFRGGTCIWKAIHGNRFSEDLDLLIDKLPTKIENYLIKELELLGFSAELIKRKQTKNMLFLKLGITSPAHPREITLMVEILESKTSNINTTTQTIYPPYPDIPPIEIKLPTNQEIITDKISAIIQRNKARDIHDLYQLLKQGATIDHELIKKRIPDFNKQKLKEKINEKKNKWKNIEPLIVTKLPSLEEETRFILSFFK
jgi:predicted nucleotidyltransferase component of viral defense system